ncbi:GNAT family N-acetyltransferase [Streptomyces sp. NPDC054933]
MAVLPEPLTGPGRTAFCVVFVSYYVRPEVRGSGTAERLLRTAVEWSWRQREVERVRLWVTSENSRAFAFYTRLGFSKTGVSAPHPPDPSLTGYEVELARPR